MLSSADRAAQLATEAPPTLAEAPPRRLGMADQAALWGNLGVTLTIPVARPSCSGRPPSCPP
jgi:hypothetical protein